MNPAQPNAEAVSAFFQQVPRLYARHAKRTGNSYQALLYSIEHPLDQADLEAITDAYQFRPPTWTSQGAAAAIQVIDGLRYPDVQPLGWLRAVPGLNLSALSHIIHHVHQAYPPYDKASCDGLARLGVDVPFVKLREPAVYGHYTSVIEQLKVLIPYWDVPETNVVLGRIIQGALHEYGLHG